MSILLISSIVASMLPVYTISSNDFTSACTKFTFLIRPSHKLCSCVSSLKTEISLARCSYQIIPSDSEVLNDPCCKMANAYFQNHVQQPYGQSTIFQLGKDVHSHGRVVEGNLECSKCRDAVHASTRSQQCTAANRRNSWETHGRLNFFHCHQTTFDPL